MPFNIRQCHLLDSSEGGKISPCDWLVVCVETSGVKGGHGDERTDAAGEPDTRTIALSHILQILTK